ncbi:putative pentatricopeptide repeat-containing protein At3g16890, mitochondrial [Arachis duranensis]|uniref:Pentatricopeptide repeat-containing protein At3g16890, mitochondrial n=1 Tax=Arachis duranensis TaxID=130453 RepID=A0A9C6WN10_ARADU|nr:putative pentatricopeptide repeat-containing protein At3g16890, mitochondrial [Arachis hypogaea]XP_052107808.1 putative pentatricopeptide repeat-containing protein At3g16890, mitochondrial [Arachis duranensis]QHO28650.1 Putative pentatricopeptide repeat-containing protein [Arachis hypogaea]
MSERLRRFSSSPSPPTHTLSSSSSSSASQPSNSSPIDHSYIARILSRTDWALLLKHEFSKNKVSLLNPRFVVSIFQNKYNPLHSIRFYTWVSAANPSLANNQTLHRVLGNTLYRTGPVVLSADLIKDVSDSGFRVSEELLCVLFWSWDRLGLAIYCGDVFGQISFLGISPRTMLYNALIDALVKSNSIYQAYLRFQQMLADNCTPDRITYNILIHGVCQKGVVDEAL